MKRNWTPIIVLLSISLMILLSIQSAGAKSEGKLTVVVQTLGTEVLDTIKWVAGWDEVALGSMGDALVVREIIGTDLGYNPMIAASWTTSPDLLTWEFTIRKDVTFHDGTKLTIDDCYNTWNRILYSKKSLAHSAKRMTKSVKAVGDDKLVFQMKAPNAFFLWKASNYAIHPKAYVEKVGEDAFGKKPIYAGPFKFVEHKEGDYIELEAFEDHYRHVPAYKSLMLRVVPEASTQLAMLKTGETDVIYRVPIGPAIKEVQDEPGIQTIMLPANGQRYVGFNNLAKTKETPSIFWDKRVRHALSYAIDRKLIIEKVFFGAGRPAAVDAIMVGSPQWHPDCKPHVYDPEKVKVLLKEAGFPNGFETELFLTVSTKNLGEALASMWQRVGIKTKVVMMEAGTYNKKVRTRTLPEGLRISSHATTHTGKWYYHRNDQLYTAMLDDKLDALVREMGSMPESPAMDVFIKEKLCRYIYDLAPSIPILERMIVNAVRDTIDTTEWVKHGAKAGSYIPILEYLKPKM